MQCSHILSTETDFMQENHLNNEMLSLMILAGMKVVGIAENIHIFKTTSAVINNFIVQ